MSGTLQDVMYTGPPTSSSGSTSHHGPSPAIHDAGNNHPSNGSGGASTHRSGYDAASGGGGGGSKRKEATTEDEDDAEARKRKQKFTRSRTACFQCRSRKSKCGAVPPDPCSNCIEAGLGCTWPAEDGRSSRARMERKARMSGQQGVGMGMGFDVKPNIGVLHGHGSGNGNGNGNAHANAHDENGSGDDAEQGWFDQLLRQGMVPQQEPFPPPQHHPPPPGTIDMSNALAPLAPLPPSTGSSTLFSSSFTAPHAGPSTQISQTMIPPQPPQNNGFGAVQPSMDPAQFIWAVSSRLPTVEESSPFDFASAGSGPSPKVSSSGKKLKGEEGKIVKVTWWRPHGQTAIAPGLKRITLKVRVDSPQDTWRNHSPRPVGQTASDVNQEVIAPDGAPSTPIMRHLLDVFMVHFGCQYPFLDRASLEAKIEGRTGSTFLLNSIAAIAARFSTHPAIALPDMKNYDYGNVFYSRAKAMLGSMLAVPSRETVGAFILLASCGFANDSESEVWMMTGLAVRMSIDLGLHLNPPESSNISPEERRLNRLVFWSVLLMDYALAFGVGRSTTYRVEEITQPIPTQEDFHPIDSPSSTDNSAPRSPFPFCAKMMISYGPLVNMLNMGDVTLEPQIADARAAAIREYNRLPADMHWNVANLQRHSRANQASSFLHLHLWMHTILASGYLTGTDMLRRGHKANRSEGNLGAATPNSATASNLWRNSARTIGDILVLSDIICPLAYCALPFVNQAFFVAGCCYVKELENTSRSAAPSPAGSPRRIPAGLQMSSITNINHDHLLPSSANIDMSGSSSGIDKDGKHVDLSRALLASVASTNISTLQQGLERQNVYWQGTAWISSALKQRVEGMAEVDLVGVTEKLASSVSLPDAGLVGRKALEESGDGPGPGNMMSLFGTGTGFTPGIDWMTFTPGPGTGNNDMAGPGAGNGGMGFGDMDFLSSLPFDMGHTDSAQNVIEQDVPLPQMFDPQWFK